MDARFSMVRERDRVSERYSIRERYRVSERDIGYQRER